MYEERTRMFTLQYTSSLSELEDYLDAQLKKYIQRKEFENIWAFKMKSYYEKELRLLRKQIYDSPQILKELCFMAFLGYLTKKKNVAVSNIVIQCPFVLHLLGVTFCDEFEEEFIVKSIYPKGKINAVAYYVDEKFFECTQKDIDMFLKQTNHIAVWVGDSDITKAPVKLKVIPIELADLYYGNNCAREESSIEICPGEVYDFFSIQNERRDLSETERQAIVDYRNQETTLETVIQVLASSIINYFSPSVCSYYEIMEQLGDNVYSREELYDYFLENGMTEERASYWAEEIRKGKLGWKIRDYKISYEDYMELYNVIGLERLNLYSRIRHLPARGSVLEKFHRLIAQTDLTDIIDDSNEKIGKSV